MNKKYWEKRKQSICEEINALMDEGDFNTPFVNYLRGKTDMIIEFLEH